MGFHVCEYCQQEGQLGQVQSMLYSPTSSADVVLEFANGNKWRLPWEGLPHYVAVHHYLPPALFIVDVMTGELVVKTGSSSFMQTKSVKEPPTPVGYLMAETFETGEVPEGFFARLEQLVARVRNSGGDGFLQTRGM